MEEAIEVMARVDEEWGSLTGRRYGAIESYRVEEADLLLVTSGTVTSRPNA